jgi:hypothetical protein
VRHRCGNSSPANSPPRHHIAPVTPTTSSACARNSRPFPRWESRVAWARRIVHRSCRCLRFLPCYADRGPRAVIHGEFQSHEFAVLRVLRFALVHGGVVPGDRARHRRSLRRRALRATRAFAVARRRWGLCPWIVRQRPWLKRTLTDSWGRRIVIVWVGRSRVGEAPEPWISNPSVRIRFGIIKSWP